jgi:hypothetical protein
MNLLVIEKRSLQEEKQYSVNNIATSSIKSGKNILTGMKIALKNLTTTFDQRIVFQPLKSSPSYNFCLKRPNLLQLFEMIGSWTLS